MARECGYINGNLAALRWVLGEETEFQRVMQATPPLAANHEFEVS